MSRIEYGSSFKPYKGKGPYCGDVGIIIEFSSKCLLVLTDGLGHGKLAEDAAMAVKEYVEKNYATEPIKLMQEAHEKIRKTRGGVTTICLLDIETGQLEHVGIGNITTRILGTSPRSLVSKDGIVGYMMTTPRKNITSLKNGDILLMYSDGLKTYIDGRDNKELLYKPARDIAIGLIAKYGKEDDDKSCLVLKYYK